jgi:hypothetical protein
LGQTASIRCPRFVGNLRAVRQANEAPHSGRPRPPQTAYR